MINFINFMFIFTVTATILLALLLLFERFLGIDKTYLLLKVIGVFCLLPAAVMIMIYIFQSADEVVSIDSEDFSYMVTNEGLRKFSAVTDPVVLQINKITFVV